MIKSGYSAISESIEVAKFDFEINRSSNNLKLLDKWIDDLKPGTIIHTFGDKHTLKCRVDGADKYYAISKDYQLSGIEVPKSGLMNYIIQTAKVGRSRSIKPIQIEIRDSNDAWVRRIKSV